MCGIAGVYYADRARPVDRRIVERMIGAMAHRGPDGTGFHEAPGICLGMCRLAIIDVAGGAQPMYGADGRIAVIQNGEIYNHVELASDLRAAGVIVRTRSDTEVLVHLYEHDGTEFARRLNGMFAVAVYDSRDHRLVLARDRIGKKPLYVWRDQHTVVFASELPALLASGLVPLDVDSGALWDLLSYNYVPGDASLVAGVHQVPPATVLSLTSQGLHSSRYWSPDLVPDTRLPGVVADEFAAIFEDSIRLRLRADAPVSVFLSGGIDSAAVAWGASRVLGDGAITAYTISFPGDRGDEGADAAATASSLGLTHVVLNGVTDPVDMWPGALQHCDAPHGDVSFLAVRAVAKAVSARARVALTGDGADEILAGYEWHRALGPGIMAPDAAALREAWERNSVFPTPLKRHLLPSLHADDSFRHVQSAAAEAVGLDAVGMHGWIDVRTLLPGNNLVKVDRMGMAESLEIRSPFLDHRLIELLIRTPASAKVGARGDKLLLRQLLSERLPEVAAREKRMFRVPIERWFAPGGAAAEWVNRLVGAPAPLIAQAFDRDALARLVREQLEGRGNHLRQIRLLVAIDLWAREHLPAS